MTLSVRHAEKPSDIKKEEKKNKNKKNIAINFHYTKFSCIE